MVTARRLVDPQQNIAAMTNGTATVFFSPTVAELYRQQKGRALKLVSAAWPTVGTLSGGGLCMWDCWARDQWPMASNAMTRIH